MSSAVQQNQVIDRWVRNTKVFRILFHRMGAPYRPGTDKHSQYKELSVFLLCWSAKLTAIEEREIRSGRNWTNYDLQGPLDQLLIQYHELLFFLKARGASPALSLEDVERLYQSLKKRKKSEYTANKKAG